MVVQGEGAPMGTPHNQIQTPTGRGVIPQNQNQTNCTVDCYTHKSLKCLYTNAASLMNKFHEFKGRIESGGFMLVGVTEVKPKNQRYPITPSEISLDNYDMYHNINMGIGRGVALYIHKTLHATPFLSCLTVYQEAVWAEIKLNKRDTLLVSCVYRSPGSSDANNEYLNDLIKEVKRYKHTHFLLLGDFNFPNIDWNVFNTASGNEESADFKFVDCLRDNCLYQHVTSPTRGRIGYNANILDLVITNEECMIDEMVHESPIGKSDHSVLTVKYKCYAEIAEGRRTKYYYDKGDYQGLRTKFENADWNVLLGNGNIDDQWYRLKEFIKLSENEYIPHRVVNNSGKHKGKIPLDQASVRKIKKKHALWKRYMETREGRYYDEFCKMRNKVRKLTRNLQKQFEKKLANEAKTNPKAIWKYINSKSKTREGVAQLNTDPRDPHSELTSSNKGKSDVLGRFFSSVFTDEPDGNIPRIPDSLLKERMGVLVINEDEVRTKLCNLNVNKSSGPDGIHPRILRELSNQLCIPLTLLFNESLSCGTLPAEWKEGLVSAIFKKGSRKNAGNYRPVSLTSIVCKCMEQCIKDHIVRHMMANDLFSTQQFGFIKGRSTVLQLLKVMEIWTRALDNGHAIDTIYLDFMKAFDTVPHRRLIGKLESIGIHGQIVSYGYRTFYQIEYK